MTEPILIKAGDERVVINGTSPLVNCRIVAEDNYQKLIKNEKTVEQLKKEQIELESKVKELINKFMEENEGYGFRISTGLKTVEVYCGKTSYPTIESEIYVL